MVGGVKHTEQCAAHSRLSVRGRDCNSLFVFSLVSVNQNDIVNHMNHRLLGLLNLRLRISI